MSDSLYQIEFLDWSRNLKRTEQARSFRFEISFTIEGKTWSCESAKYITKIFLIECFFIIAIRLINLGKENKDVNLLSDYWVSCGSLAKFVLRTIMSWPLGWWRLIAWAWETKSSRYMIKQCLSIMHFDMTGGPRMMIWGKNKDSRVQR